MTPAAAPAVAAAMRTRMAATTTKSTTLQQIHHQAGWVFKVWDQSKSVSREEVPTPNAKFQRKLVLFKWVSTEDEHLNLVGMFVIFRGHHLKRMGDNVSISHKTHHISCGKNRSTHGSSARTVAVKRHAEEMTVRNNLPLSLGHTEGLPSAIQQFEKTSTTTKTTTTTTTTTTTEFAGTTTTTTNDVFVASDKEDKNEQQGD
jgi:hypothetical protein